MADQKIFHAPKVDVEHLGQALSQWFRNQGFETQLLQGPSGGWIVQARKSDVLRSMVGMAAALNVTLTTQDDTLIAQVGAAAWADKAVMGAVGAVLFWPALIPAAFGAWKQKQLPEQTFHYIEQYLALEGRVTEADLARITERMGNPPDREEVACPKCGQAVRVGAKFCDNCGTNMMVTCAKCGANLRPGAKFCDGCGAAVEAAK